MRSIAEQNSTTCSSAVWILILDLTTVLKILPFSSKIMADPSIVKRYAISPANVSNYVVPDTGAMVLIPDPVSISEIIRQAFYQ